MSYVIGGGLAGLIWAYFHPQTEIIAGADLEERQKDWVIPLPKYIYDTPQSRRFLEQVLGEKVKSRTVNVGICYKDYRGIVPPKIRDLCRRLYYEKTRGVKLEKEKPVPKEAMGSGKFSFEVLDFPFHNLEQELLELMRERCIFSNVWKFDLANKTLFLDELGNPSLKWAEIVVTIPQPDFWALCKGYEERAMFFKSKPVWIYDADFSGPDWFWRSPFDYFLFPDPTLSFFRITKGPDKRVGIEFSEEKDMISQLSSLFWKEGKIWRMTVLRHGKIVSKHSGSLSWEVNFPPWSEEIRFFGRFGTWKSDLKVHDLIEEACGHARKMSEPLEGMQK